MNKQNDIISNISYTNKDFNSIYNELLDLTKNLSDTWDPSQSNESDPGVVLLKLAALIGDKNNYNIDKNVLECFPLSVTQEGNARNLYDSLGYHMKWYQSATLGVSDTSQGVGFAINNSEQLTSYTLPAFTILCNSAKDITYCTLTKVELETDKVVYSPVIQGSPFDYSVNGNTTITLNNLDSNLRLYFTDTKIAENGIFIKNANTGDNWFESDWKKVDNLSSYANQEKVFAFGVLPNSNICYIQFPDDIANIIGDGLNIKYVVSSGEDGNIKSNVLTDFLNDLSYGTGEEQISVNDYINIIQIDPITSGKDPETLKQAYENYKRIVGTFNTLVTKRDYENYIYNLNFNNLPVISNCKVTDRTNDLNTTVKYQVWDPNYSNPEYVNSQMSPYQIGLYLLNYVENISTKENYYQTFSPNMDQYKLMDINSSLEDIKAVQHDLILPTSNTFTNIDPIKFMFINDYIIKGSILTYFNVSEQEAKDIENNVLTTLYQSFNSRNLHYGEGLSYEEIIDTIIKADSRIKNVILNQVSYDTNLITNRNEIIPFNDDNIDICNEIVAKSILAGTTSLYNISNYFKYDFGQSSAKAYIIEEGKTVPNYTSFTSTDDYIGYYIVSSNNCYEITSSNKDIMRIIPGSTIPYTEELNYTYLSILNGIKSITTEFNAEIPSERDTLKLTLKDNQIIQLYAPSYVTTTNYGYYTTYTWNSINSINQNEVYVLTNDETLVISEIYVNGELQDPITLSAGTIIQPTFTLNANSSGVLKSDQFIYKKELDTRDLTQGTNYIFISNDSQDIVEIDDTVGRLLTDNEFLLIPNSTKTELIIWGSGTLLKAKSGTIRLKRTILKDEDTNKYIKENITNINWNILPNDLNITVMDIISLGANTILYAQNKIIANNKAHFLGENKLYYQNPGEDTFTVITSNNTQNWQIRSRLMINSNIDNNQRLHQYENLIIVKEENSTEVTYIISEGDTNQPYFVFNNSIVLPGGQEYSTEDLDITEGFIYNGSFYERDPQTGMINYSYTSTGGNHYTLSTGIMTSADADSETRKAYSWLVPIKVTTSSDPNSYVSMTNCEIFNPYASNYSDEGQKTFATLPTLSSSILNKYYYVTDAFITDNRFVEGAGKSYPANTRVLVINIGTSSTPIYKYTIYNPNNVSHLTTGVYILRIFSSDYITLTLHVDSSIEISYPIKLNGLNQEINYSNINLTYNINEQEENIYKIINDLSIHTNSNIIEKFNYLYIPEEKSKIVCPLEPESFWDNNHIYNKFILPRINFEKSSIKVNNSNIF